MSDIQFEKIQQPNSEAVEIARNRFLYEVKRAVAAANSVRNSLGLAPAPVSTSERLLPIDSLQPTHFAPLTPAKSEMLTPVDALGSQHMNANNENVTELRRAAEAAIKEAFESPTEG